MVASSRDGSVDLGRIGVDHVCAHTDQARRPRITPTEIMIHGALHPVRRTHRARSRSRRAARDDNLAVTVNPLLIASCVLLRDALAERTSVAGVDVSAPGIGAFGSATVVSHGRQVPCLKWR